jgi:uncharacterized membrane protein YsdA (DUF1294 family)/cold shock CspA family protein
MKSGIHSGKLTRWNDDRGFGFIQPVDGSQEVFLHISELKDATRRPQENDTIYYQCIVGSNGKLRACNASILGARKSISPAIPLKGKAKPSARSTSNFLLVKVILLSILPLIGIVHFTWKTGNPLPLILYLLMSLVTYFLYADDKSRAKRNDWRTSEQTLHFCELAGGWLGGFIAQRKLRHKSKKISYQVVFWAIVIIHYIAWLLWLFWDKTL